VAHSSSVRLRPRLTAGLLEFPVADWGMAVELTFHLLLQVKQAPRQ